jgi:hypothetical protein
MERFPSKYKIFLFSFDMNENKNQPRIGLNHSVLSLFYFESHSEFSPFWVQSKRSWVHSGLSPFGIESLRGWVHSAFSPFGVRSIGGFSPIRGWVHSDYSPILGSVGESYSRYGPGHDNTNTSKQLPPLLAIFSSLQSSNWGTADLDQKFSIT